MMRDIENLKDVTFLVDTFYAQVQSDSLLGPVFEQRLTGRWEMHHKKLYRFWNTVLLRKPDYFGNPVPMHFSMNIDKMHFDRWLDIWNETIDSNFSGEVAERAKHRGKTMADAFLEKIEKATKK